MPWIWHDQQLHELLWWSLHQHVHGRTDWMHAIGMGDAPCHCWQFVWLCIGTCGFQNRKEHEGKWEGQWEEQKEGSLQKSQFAQEGWHAIQWEFWHTHLWQHCSGSSWSISTNALGKRRCPALHFSMIQIPHGVGFSEALWTPHGAGFSEDLFVVVMVGNDSIFQSFSQILFHCPLCGCPHCERKGFLSQLCWLVVAVMVSKMPITDCLLCSQISSHCPPTPLSASPMLPT